MVASHKSWIFAAGLAISLIQCRKPLTVLAVEIDTDVRLSPAPATPVREISITAQYSWDGITPANMMTAERADITRGVGPAQVCLPESFGIRVKPEHEGEPLTLLVETAGGQYRRIITITPVAYRTQILKVRVHSQCLSSVTASPTAPCPNGARTCSLALSCEERGQACGNEGTCVPRTIDSTTLDVIPEAQRADVQTNSPVNGECVVSDFGASAMDVPTAPTDAADVPSDVPTDVPSG